MIEGLRIVHDDLTVYIRQERSDGREVSFHRSHVLHTRAWCHAAFRFEVVGDINVYSEDSESKHMLLPAHSMEALDRRF